MRELDRICIYPKDAQKVTGKSARSGRRLITEIREHLGKEEHQLITIAEFCKYLGLPIAEVVAKIR